MEQFSLLGPLFIFEGGADDPRDLNLPLYLDRRLWVIGIIRWDLCAAKCGEDLHCEQGEGETS